MSQEAHKHNDPSPESMPDELIVKGSRLVKLNGMVRIYASSFLKTCFLRRRLSFFYWEITRLAETRVCPSKPTLSLHELVDPDMFFFKKF